MVYSRAQQLRPVDGSGSSYFRSQLLQDLLHVLTGDGVVKRLLLDELDLVTQLVQLLEKLPFSDWNVHDDSTHVRIAMEELEGISLSYCIIDCGTTISSTT